MTWIVKRKNKYYLVMKPGEDSFKFNNKIDAERLCDKLNNFNSSWCKVSEKLIREGEALIDFGNELIRLGEEK